LESCGWRSWINVSISAVRLQLVGGTFERNEFALHWPIWREPIGLATIRALLTHPDLCDGPELIRQLCKRPFALDRRQRHLRLEGRRVFPPCSSAHRRS
jgi:hypothetical protein